MSYPHLSHVTFHCITSPFFLSFLLPPTHSSTHPYVDREHHVPEQDKGAVGSREGQCALLSSLLCIFHLLPPLSHGCARHPQLSGHRRRGASGPKARRKWGCCRSGRWWWRREQQQCTIKCGRGTPAPVAHLPEHHRCACSLNGYHDCR